MVVLNEKEKRQWYNETLGKPRRVVAPMVSQSELAFRMLCRHHGAELTYTQMHNAKMLLKSEKYQRDVNLDLNCEKEDRPRFVQLCGDDPGVLLEAGLMVEDRCDAIDINCGCPQGIAKRGHYGAFLLDEPDLVCDLVRSLAHGLKRVPVTIKIRLLDPNDPRPTIALCHKLCDAGAALITIHGRTRDMKGHFVGAANWDALAAIVKEMRPRLPIIANGGIEFASDIDACLKATGADGVMVSEACLADPTIFSPIAATELKTKSSKIQIALQYLDLCKSVASEGTSLGDARAHLVKFLFEILQTDGNAQLRNDLVASCNWDHLAAAVRRLDRLGIKPNSKNKTKFDLSTAPSWYRRYRQKRRHDLPIHFMHNNTTIADLPPIPTAGARTSKSFSILDNDSSDEEVDDDEAPDASSVSSLAPVVVSEEEEEEEEEATIPTTSKGSTGNALYALFGESDF